MNEKGKRAIEDAVRGMTTDLQQRIDAELLAMTTNNSAPHKHDLSCLSAVSDGLVTTSKASFDTLTIEDIEKCAREARRNQVTIIADVSHQGPILAYETPCDGTRIEMSFGDLEKLHREWPLMRSKVLSAWSAEYIPVAPWPGQIFSIDIEMPPFPPTSKA